MPSLVEVKVGNTVGGLKEFKRVSIPTSSREAILLTGMTEVCVCVVCVCVLVANIICIFLTIIYVHVAVVQYVLYFKSAIFYPLPLSACVCVCVCVFVCVCVDSTIL